MADHRREQNNDNLSQFEKELKKLIILAETGVEQIDEFKELNGTFVNPSDLHLSPLNNDFEDSGILSLKEKLGNPSFPRVNHLTDEEIEIELGRAKVMLASLVVNVDSIYPVSPRDMYRFITTQLIHFICREIEDGILMPTTYLYEDYHPNHPEDLKDQVRDIINSICDKDFMEYQLWCSPEIKFQNEICKLEDFINKMHYHLEFFDKLIDPNIETIVLNINEVTAMAQCVFTLYHETSNGEKVTITGNAKFKFRLNVDCFELTEICIPELGI